jgi:hypothetical protein
MIRTDKVGRTWCFEADSLIVIGFSSKNEVVLTGIEHLLEKRKTELMTRRKALCK